MIYLKLPSADGAVLSVRYDKIIVITQNEAEPRRCMIVLDHATAVLAVEFEPTYADFDQTTAREIVLDMIEQARVRYHRQSGLA